MILKLFFKLAFWSYFQISVGLLELGFSTVLFSKKAVTGCVEIVQCRDVSARTSCCSFVPHPAMQLSGMSNHVLRLSFVLGLLSDPFPPERTESMYSMCLFMIIGCQSTC